ncbi:MAG: hypothetical protein KBS56_01585 [Clostridiales bacterium]|nr:hypothetical protein [Candidatus Crickella equi]
MLRNNNEIKTYNVMFPLWFLIWIPSYLWLLLIPINYAIDTSVTWYTLRDLEDHKKFCLRHSWKICIAGFVCDLLGSLILLGATLLETIPNLSSDNEIFTNIAGGIMMNPFNNLGSFIICLIALAFSAILIYLIDRKILFKAGLDINRATHSAKWLAIITAPYLFLLPSGWLYSGAF